MDEKSIKTELAKNIFNTYFNYASETYLPQNYYLYLQITNHKLQQVNMKTFYETVVRLVLTRTCMKDQN